MKTGPHHHVEAGKDRSVTKALFEALSLQSIELRRERTYGYR